MNKMDKMIWVIDNPFDYYQVYQAFSKFELPKGAYLHRRGDAETDKTKLQIIPYVLVQTISYEHSINGSFKVIVGTRTKSGGEKRLTGKKTLGIGGHLEPEDISNNSFMPGLKRELEEEIGLSLMKNKLKFSHIIYQPINDVSAVHIGAAYIATIDYNDFEELAPKDSELVLDRIDFTTYHTKSLNIEEYEPWSLTFFSKV